MCARAAFRTVVESMTEPSGSNRSWHRERRLLRAAVAAVATVPVAAGAAGVFLGADLLDATSTDRISADSHIRYLSGLLLGIGLLSWSIVPHIERAGSTFQIITTVVVAGGLARLASLVANGVPSKPMLAGLTLELIVTPALAVWQRRLARGPGPC
jgi:hypothetical protein